MTARPTPTVPRTSPFGTVTFHRFLYLASALPLAGLWLALVVAGWALTLGLVITPLALGVLIGFGASVRFAAWSEGFLARRLLRAPTYPRRRTPRRDGYWKAGVGTLRDGRFWRGQAFLFLRAVLGLVTGVVVVAVLAVGLGGIAAPVIYRFLPNDDGPNGFDFGFWVADSLREALVLVPVGAALVALGLVLVNVFGSMWRRLAVGVLGGNND